MFNSVARIWVVSILLGRFNFVVIWFFRFQNDGMTMPREYVK